MAFFKIQIKKSKRSHTFIMIFHSTFRLKGDLTAYRRVLSAPARLSDPPTACCPLSSTPTTSPASPDSCSPTATKATPISSSIEQRER